MPDVRGVQQIVFNPLYFQRVQNFKNKLCNNLQRQNKTNPKTIIRKTELHWIGLVLLQGLL